MNGQTASAFLSIGFRPFYLGAALLAMVSVPLWVGAYFSATPIPTGYPAYLWHMHEMLFGFGVAVMAGFLLTAVRNWTGCPSPSGPTLGCLFGLWLLGRARVAGPWAIPEQAQVAILLSAVFWSAAFATFVFRYAPMLVRPRLECESATTTGSIRVGR